MAFRTCSAPASTSGRLGLGPPLHKQVLRCPKTSPGRCIQAVVQLHPCRAHRSSASACQCSHPQPAAAAPTSHRNLQLHKSLQHQSHPVSHGISLSRLTACMLPALLCCQAAFAADGVAYNPSGGSELVKNVFGFLYVVLLAVFVLRLFRRRAQRATSERLASKAAELDAAEGEDMDAADRPTSPFSAAWGAVQAAFFTVLLFQLSTNVDAYFGKQELPDQFTARNVTVTLRTIIQGLAYLATFIFGANAVGLTGLTLQLLISPETPAAADPVAKPDDQQKLE